MAAPATMPEFKGSVVAVQTAPYWSAELGAIADKHEMVGQMRWFLDSKSKDHANADGRMSDEQKHEYVKAYEAKLISPAEAARWQRGASNAGYHYLGCAKNLRPDGQGVRRSLARHHEREEAPMNHWRPAVPALATPPVSVMNYRLLVVAMLSTLGLLPAQVAFQNGDKVAFLGDSITQEGQDGPGGYVQLVGSGLAANGVKIEIVGAGISGHKSNDMLARLDRDVLSKKPQWMTLSCGVNDVWHGDDGVPLPDYQKNITAIVDRAQAAGVKVVILTSTMIGEDATEPDNVTLGGYNEFLRALAKAKGCRLADVNAEMQAALVEARKTKAKPASGNYLTTDGVHMAAAGNRMMAVGVLQAIGLDAAQLAKATEAWLDIPDTNRVSAGMSLTQRQFEQLERLAARRKLTLEGLLEQEFGKVVQTLLEGSGR